MVTSQIGGERNIDRAVEILRRPVGIGHHVPLEDIGGQPQRGTGIGDIDHARDMPLHWRGAEDGVGLRARIAKFLQVFDGVETCLAIGDMDVEIMLMPAFID